MTNSGNKLALSKAVSSAFSNTPRTEILTVLRRTQEETITNVWMDMVDENGGISGISAIHFDELPEIGQRFEVTTIGCNILSVKLIEGEQYE